MLLQKLRWLDVVQFGVGGTGSWLVPMVSKFLNNISNRFSPNNLVTRYVLVDPDFIEERNILRQNFNNDDIGRNKASVHKLRNITTYRNILPIRKMMKSKTSMSKNIPQIHNGGEGLLITIGCVDSNKIRREIFKYSRDSNVSSVYIDGGNDVYHGQIVTCAFNVHNELFENADKYKNPKFYKIYDIKNDNQGNDQDCAFFGDQTQGINSYSATLLFLNLQQLLINEIIPPSYITFNGSGFSMFEV